MNITATPSPAVNAVRRSDRESERCRSIMMARARRLLCSMAPFDETPRAARLTGQTVERRAAEQKYKQLVLAVWRQIYDPAPRTITIDPKGEVTYSW